jgi:NapC/NirT cytochrome c family, N-terminal region/Cytochrome c3
MGMGMSSGEATRRPRRLWRNRVTLAGGSLMLLALLFILSLLFFDAITPKPSPYLGLFTFLILPGFMMLGFALVVLGFLLARRRVRRRYGGLGRVEYYPRIDLNDPAQRRVLLITGLIIAATLPFIGFMSFEGYDYTDSNQFCGAVCHTVMQPQFVAHERGSHARVDCAECHIGSGASWYVKSKISGLRQVLAITMRTYERPIPPAITELRPARETCEQCHWPEKFYGDQLVTLQHFASDEASSPRTLRMILKTGGGDSNVGPPSGIHWHMAIDNRIEFVATDEELQVIPWVRAATHSNGKDAVYRSDGRAASDPPPAGRRRTMDCLDCHNRATHVFQSPQLGADRALRVDPVLRELPYAKRELVAATATAYPSREAAFAGVAEALRGFYEREYPDVAATRKADIDRLVAAAREIVDLSYFPSMRVDWRTYPNNIGHLIFAGCFRCHDGRHVDAKGQPLTIECSTCHTFEAPTDAAADTWKETGGFAHPIKLEGAHGRLLCDRCHSGGLSPAPTCEGCHADVAAFMGGTLPALAKYDIEASPMDETDCVDCHDLSEPTDVPTLQAACAECHEEPEYEHMVAEWRSEADRLLAKAEAHAGPQARDVLAALRKAGPLHNIDATVTVLSALAGEETAGTRPPPP